MHGIGASFEPPQEPALIVGFHISARVTVQLIQALQQCSQLLRDLCPRPPLHRLLAVLADPLYGGTQPSRFCFQANFIRRQFLQLVARLPQNAYREKFGGLYQGAPRNKRTTVRNKSQAPNMTVTNGYVTVTKITVNGGTWCNQQMTCGAKEKLVNNAFPGNCHHTAASRIPRATSSPRSTNATSL